MITLHQFVASALGEGASLQLPGGAQVPVARAAVLELYATALQDHRAYGLYRHGHVEDWTVSVDLAHVDVDVAVVIGPAGLRYMLPNTPTHEVERLCPVLGCDQDRPKHPSASCPDHACAGPEGDGPLSQGTPAGAASSGKCGVGGEPEGGASGEQHGLREVRPAGRGREVSRLLTEVRTVLSRAVSALPAGPTEPLYEADGRRPLYNDRDQWVRAYDPDHDAVHAALRDVIALLAPWQRTGRPEGTEQQRQARLEVVRCACGRIWAGRVGNGHVTGPATH
ncbi:hypothetical protein OG413_44980 [Streptomyces sp. NBC_01433]|uniref:hypothetical protein n=1 Tax=Streptomyces sp. NBC_01433 TaxID=2903864 RepID=UPI00225B3D6C|nr:hypothetical protein [Streptomyces sp. NBC_01433]MCX4682341.1 hypothetical protein [Streptomyces sp. NBC_01433]